MLRHSAAGFVADAGKPALVRARRKSERGYDRALWRTMAEQGWLQLAIPEPQGGFGLGLADQAALHEEIGKGALPEPLAAVGVLAAGALAAGRGDPALLSRLLAGEMIATLAWQSRAAAFHAGDVEITARREGEAYLISGDATFVPAAVGADGFVVAARLGEGCVLLWVDAAAEGLTLRSRRLADFTPVAELTFDAVRCGPDALIVGPSQGAHVLDRLLDHGRIAVAAEAVGVMHQILSVTTDFLGMREQFGRPIGSFQALQHRAVNLYVQIELARSSVLKAAIAADGGRLGDVPALAAAAKARAADAAIAVAGQAIHLHGTIGFTEELDLSILLRRAHVLSAWLGNGEACRRRYAALRWPEGIAA